MPQNKEKRPIVSEILKEPEHNTDSKECWCNPKIEYIEESDSYIIVHNTLLPDESHTTIN